MPSAAPARSEPDAEREAASAATMANIVCRCSGSCRNSRANRAVMKGVAPNMISTFATGARPKGDDEGHRASGEETVHS